MLFRSEALLNASVVREYESQRKDGVIGTTVLTAIPRCQAQSRRIFLRKPAWILCLDLAGAESLQAVAGVVIGSVEFPAQAVVQGQIRLDLVTILREQIESRVAEVFRLRRALDVAVGRTEK